MTKNFIDVSNRNDPLSYFSRSKEKNKISNKKGWHYSKVLIPFFNILISSFHS